jgi:hypothetical protein
MNLGWIRCMTPDPDIRHSVRHAAAPREPEPPRADEDSTLDETIESTFPASDPPSSIPDPGESDDPAEEDRSGPLPSR